MCPCPCMSCLRLSFRRLRAFIIGYGDLCPGAFPAVLRPVLPLKRGYGDLIATIKPVAFRILRNSDRVILSGSFMCAQSVLYGIPVFFDRL